MKKEKNTFLNYNGENIDHFENCNNFFISLKITLTLLRISLTLKESSHFSSILSSIWDHSDVFKSWHSFLMLEVITLNPGNLDN